MTPDEVLVELVKKGIIVSRKTLLNYENRGLIPKPNRGSGGRGVGRFTDYPIGTVEQAVKAHYMLNNQVEYWKNRALKAEKQLRQQNEKEN